MSGKKGMDRVKGLQMVLGGSIGLMLCFDLTLYMRAHEAAGHAAEHAPAWMGYPGFELAFGLLGAFALGLAAKLILFPLLKRDENYYAEEPGGEG